VGLVVQSDGTAHFVFRTTDGQLTHSWGKAGGPYSEEKMTSIALSYDLCRQSLFMTSDGTLHAFHHSSGFQHLTRGNSGWTTESLVLAGTTAPASAGRDSRGAFHLLWGLTESRYASNASGTWTVDDSALPIGASDCYAIGVSPGGEVHTTSSSGSGGIWHHRKTAPDGVDQNCDGVDGVDADRDGFASIATGGSDCNDLSASVYPGATDMAGDGIDQNCDGLGGP
jgi:hypothetical protein